MINPRRAFPLVVLKGGLGMRLPRDLHVQIYVNLGRGLEER